MPETSESYRELPPHLESSVRSIAELHAEHHKQATRVERHIAQLTAGFGTPRFIIALYCLTVTWMVVNTWIETNYSWSIDPPPFPWLSTVSSLLSVYMVALVIATQRRDDQLAERRDQLTLELAILNEQKVTKVIQLFEEYRRDNPYVADRDDPEAEAMAQPSDPNKVLIAITETHAQLEEKPS